MSQTTASINTNERAVRPISPRDIPVTACELEQLRSLHQSGPLFPGDCLGSHLTSSLFSKGLVNYGVVKGQHGFIYCTLLGEQVLKSIRAEFVR